SDRTTTTISALTTASCTAARTAAVTVARPVPSRPTAATATATATSTSSTAPRPGPMTTVEPPTAHLLPAWPGRSPAAASAVIGMRWARRLLAGRRRRGDRGDVGDGLGPDEQHRARGVVDDEPTRPAEAARAEPAAVAVTGADEQVRTRVLGGLHDLVLDPGRGP